MLEELFKSLIFLLKFDEEFLGMTPGLRARTGLHVQLHVLPLLAVQLEGLKEAEVLVSRPSA